MTMGNSSKYLEKKRPIGPTGAVSKRTMWRALKRWCIGRGWRKASSIFAVVRRVKRETDEISFKRQIDMVRTQEIRSPVGL
jgi:hypothetical protein